MDKEEGAPAQRFGADTRSVSALVFDARKAFLRQFERSVMPNELAAMFAAFNNAITELAIELEDSRRANAELAVELQCERLKHKSVAKLAMRSARMKVRYK